MGYHARDNSVSVSRRVRMKSSDMSKSFTEINDKRKKSLNLALQRPDHRNGGRILSLNAEQLDNSLKDIDPEETEVLERKQRLILIAKMR